VSTRIRRGWRQCERFFRKMSGVEIIATYDTAGSAKMIREKGIRHAGAIRVRARREVFGLVVLESQIQDFEEKHHAAFLVISRSAAPVEGANKTTIVFTLSNQPGALFKALSVFALRDIDLTKLESRPIRGRAWEYLFYATLSVPRQDLQCARAPRAPRRVRPSCGRWGPYAAGRSRSGPGRDDTGRRAVRGVDRRAIE